MAVPAGSPVSAGLAQVAHMGRRERESAVRRLRRQNSAFDAMLLRVDRARVLAFASGLALVVAVVFLAGGESVWLTGALVLAGLSGFGTVSLRLADSRFDVLLAVLGEHRAGELRAEQLQCERFDTEEAAIPRQTSRAGGDDREPSPNAC